jgi:exosortase/archaeosortase family protein
LNGIHVARPIPGADGSLFNVMFHGRDFQLSVVSACSGVNGMVGFLLVGTAFGAIVTGPRRRKAVWVLGGLLLLWVVNVGRLLLIFWAGHTFGEHFAIRVLHPFVGLVTFNVGIIIMLLLLKPFGLRIGPGGKERQAGSTSSDGTTHGPMAVPAIYSAISLVVILGVVLGITNSSMRSYDLVASATGEPKLASYLDYPGSPAAWQATFSQEIDTAKPYFGESSKWYRYTYTSSASTSDLHADLPITADVINTNDLFSFSAYGVEACYRFHGYRLRNVAQVNLGGGIAGQALSYSSKNHGDWSIVYWIWPVQTGKSTRYERVILYLLNTGSGPLRGPGVSGLRNLHGSLNPQDATQRRLIEVRGFLVAFAREVIKAQARVAPGSHLERPRPTSTARNPFRQGVRFVPRPEGPRATTSTP